MKNEKNKVYDIKVELIFELEFPHKQINADKAIEDVDRVIDDYLNPNTNSVITEMFDKSPRRIYKIKISKKYNEKNKKR